MAPQPRTILACALAFAAAATEAHAQGWTATPGVRLRYKPPYEGAANHVLVPVPMLAIRRAGRPYRFIPADGGATLGLLDRDWIVAGPVLRFRGSRPDTGAYAGLKRVAVATEAGLFADLWPADWLRLRLEGRHGFGGHDGWVGDVGLDLVHMSDKWDASIGPRMGFGDDRYMQTYFGVRPGEAALRPRPGPAYAPGAGRRYTGVTVAGAYHLTPRWRLNGEVTYHRLSDKALASPVIRSLSDGNQVSAGIGIAYSLGRIG